MWKHHTQHVYILYAIYFYVRECRVVNMLTQDTKNVQVTQLVW